MVSQRSAGLDIKRIALVRPCSHRRELDYRPQHKNPKQDGDDHQHCLGKAIQILSSLLLALSSHDGNLREEELASWAEKRLNEARAVLTFGFQLSCNVAGDPMRIASH